MAGHPLSPHLYLVDADTGCWVWQRSKNNKGYGRACANGGVVLAHRHFYELHRGPIPAGLVIDHLCRNPACCNPDHLEAVTFRENMRRSITATNRPTHCQRGHAFAEHGAVVNANGNRKCRVCFRVVQRRYDERKRREKVRGRTP